MSRYIEVCHLKKSVEGLADCYNGFSDTYDKACIIGLIDEEPTADVVEVVRCKHCTRQCICYHSADYYCADGEKVTE